jgi:leader peptidase (prepilin peptidase)/N-methyltransferase
VTWFLPALAGIAGAIVGSFLATLIIRWPRREQVVAGRSKCDACRRALPAAALIPLISYLAAQGRCRGCGVRIDPLHFQVELASALLAALALLLQPGLAGAALATLWLLLLAPAVLDARHMWLPNALTLVLAAGGLLVGGLIANTSLTDRLIGGSIGYLSLSLVALAYRRWRGREGLGGGDPKLLGAIGLWTGWAALPSILLLAALMGLCAALVMGRGRLDRMPFGTLLALATMLWSGLAAAGLAPA